MALSQPVPHTSTIHLAYAMLQKNPSHPSSVSIHSTLDTSGSSPTEPALHSFLLYTPSQMNTTRHFPSTTLTSSNSFTPHLSGLLRMSIFSKHISIKSTNSLDLMLHLSCGNSPYSSVMGSWSFLYPVYGVSPIISIKETPSDHTSLDISYLPLKTTGAKLRIPSQFFFLME